MHYLKIFYDDAICSKLEDLFSDQSKLLVKQYPIMNEQSDLYLKYSKKTDVLNHIYTRYISQQMESDYCLENLINVIEGLHL